MRSLWNTARKDLLRQARDPVGLLLWAGIPLVVGGILMLLMGGSGGVRPSAELLVADRDDTFVSDLLVRGLESVPGDLVKVQAVEEESGRELMADGEATALLVVPRGFGDAVLKEEPTTLELVTNPAQRILPRIVTELFEGFSDGVFYAHRLVGPRLLAAIEEAAGADAPVADDLTAKISDAVGDRIGELRPYLLPPVIALETEVAEEEQTGAGDGQAALFLPGIVLMALMFLAQGLSEDVWRERDQGTLARSLVAPAGTAAWLGGKALAGTAVAAAVSLVVLLPGLLALDRPLAGLLPGALWCGVVFGGLFLLMVLLQLFASSRRAGAVLTGIFVFPLLMLGGSFFPFEFMPEGLAAAGRLTPNGWALGRLDGLLSGRGGGYAAALAGLPLVLVATGLLFALCARRIARGFAGA